GRNDCVAGGVYTGDFDDIIAYGGAVSSTEVSNLYTYYSATPLPLKWVSFTARAVGDQVDLQWVTTDVVNNAHFEIERSTDGNTFVTIGSLSNKTGELGASYNFTDPAPVKGVDLYRIKQVDIDEKYSYSSTVEVNVNLPARGIYLQANPVTDVITLMNSQQQLVRGLQILDLSGRVLVNVASNSSGSEISENVGWLQPGYYFLRVFTAANATTLRFIKL